MQNGQNTSTIINSKTIANGFGDSYIQAFFYNIFSKRIELHYEGYYYEVGNFKNAPCKLIIENWQKAYSIPYVADVEYSRRKKYELDTHMGIFFMIMSVNENSEWFDITVNTIDDRFVTYLFENPQLSIVEK